MPPSSGTAAVRPVGVEPTRLPWQGSRLPVDLMDALMPIQVVKEAEWFRVSSRVGGSRTHTSAVKSRVRCRYATTPFVGVVLRLYRMSSPRFSMTRLGVALRRGVQQTRPREMREVRSSGRKIRETSSHERTG